MRIRTTVFATAVVASALLVAAAGVVILQRRSMIAGVDNTAQTHATDLAALARTGALPTSVAAGKQEDSFVQVVDSHGRVVAASDNIVGEPAVGRRGGTARSMATRDLPSLDGQFRVAAHPAASPRGPLVVYVGETLAPVQRATSGLITLLGIGIAGLLVVVAGTAWIVIGRALEPVETIRAEVEEISENELHRRVPEPESRDEVSRLAHTMNAMLGRIEDGYVRQSRFVSDASHELKSPIAAVRAHLEVGLAYPDSANWTETARASLTDVIALQRLVDDLLTLAQLPAGTRLSRHEPVDLDDVILREAERLRTRARVRVDLRGVSAGQTSGDRTHLARAIRNLLDNAERHAISTVRLSVHESGSTVEVAVADDGPGVPAHDRERIFERFARLDGARVRTGGAGLGLAIAREIVENHGGTLHVEDNHPGARFVIRLPAGSPSPQSHHVEAEPETAT